jgi:hypothetical protein
LIGCVALSATEAGEQAPGKRREAPPPRHGQCGNQEQKG